MSRKLLIAFVPVLHLAVAPGCSGAKPDDPEVLTQAVTGTIDTSAPTLVGSLPGGIAVGANGEATYSIPIAVPAGRNGMRPNLALTYSSSAGNGLLGVGWGLSGLSEITRCGKSFIRDGVNLPPQMENADAFCLDGMRLVPLVQGGTEYRTEPNTFVKVVAGASDLIAGPQQWTVYQPDGTIAYYGENADARLGYCNVNNVCYWRSSWGISRVVDTSGNTMWFSYAQDGFDDWQERRPDRIDWVAQAGQAGNRSVKFGYDTARTDVLYARTAGTASVETHRLNSITISAPAAAGASPARLRSYEITYDIGSTNRSRLRTVSLCDNQSAAAGHCLAPTIFTYSDVTPTLVQRLPANNALLSGFDYANVQPQHLQFGDVNGDGLDDLVAFVSGQWQVRLSTGSGFGPSLPQGNLPGGIGRLFDIDGDGRADMFARQDQTTTFDSSRFYLSQPASDPTAWTTFGSVASVYDVPIDADMAGINAALFDFNGDGFPEYHSGPYKAYAGSAANPVWRSTPYSGDGDPDPLWHSDYRPGWIEASVDYAHVSFVDMDGDGQLDRLLPFDDIPIDGNKYYDILFARPKSFALSKRVWQTNVPYSACNIIADIDGDGLPDIINFKSGTVYYNTGIASFRAVANAAPTDVYPTCDTSTVDQGLRVVDYDGDGKQDVLLPQSGQVLVANGAQDRNIAALKFTKLALGWTAPSPGTRRGTFTRTLDANGDGLFDVFAIDSSGNMSLFQQQMIAPPDLLVKVFDGAPALQDEVSYQPLTSSVYARGSGCSFPQSCYIGPKWVVSEERRDTGAVGSANPVPVRRHTYMDARVDVQQGWLGFGTHAVQQLDGANQVISTTIATIDWTRLVSSSYHYKHYPFAGLVSDVYTYSTDGAATKAVDTKYFYKEYVPADTAQPWFAYLSATKTTEFDGNNTYAATTIVSHVPAAVASQGYTLATGTDVQTSYRGRSTAMDWDPQTQTVKNPASPLAKTTVTTVTSNTPSTWILGLPTHMTAVSSEPTLPSITKTRSRTMTYDSAGRLVQSTIDKNSIEPWIYLRTKIAQRDTYGNPTVILATADPSNDAASDVRKTTIGYTDGIYPSSWSTTDTLGSGKTISSSALFHVGFGVALAQTDANARQTGLTYDTFGRLLRVDRPDTTFDKITRLGSTVDSGVTYPYAVKTESSDGSYAIAFLDRAGRTVHAGAPIGDTDLSQGVLTYVDLGYDAIGRTVFATRPHKAGDPSYVASYAHYDGMGRQDKTYANCLFSDVWADNANCQKTVSRFGFDPTKAVSFVEITDPSNVTRRTESDAAQSFVRTIVDPLGKALTKRYDYGPFGLVEAVWESSNAGVMIDHDSEGNVTRASDYDAGATNYSFNGFGEVIQKSDQSAQTTTFGHDSLGRLIKQSAPDGLDTWSWDTAPNGIGKLAAEIRDNGASSYRSFSYRVDERISRISQIQDGSTYNYDFTYDTQGRVTKLQYPGFTTPRFSVGYRYGLNGSLIEVQDVTTATPASVWTPAQVDTEGRVTKEQLGSGGKVRTTSFDPTKGWITAVNVPNIQDESYAYTMNGSLFSRTDNLNSPNGAAASRTETFAYDTADRLIKASVVGRTPQDFNYDYDALGNVTKSDDTGCTNFVYGGNGFGPHQLATYTCNGTTFGSAYDTNGNEVWADRPDYRATTWTTFRKPREVANRYGHLRYTYDANHQRVKKEVLSDAINGQSPVLPRQNDTLSGVWDTTIYVGKAYERRALSGSSNVDEVFTIFANGKPIAERVAHSTGTTELLYLHTDFQGSITRTSTASGALKEVISSDIWGVRRSGNWADTSNSWTNAGVTWPSTTRRGFTGHEHDDELWGVSGGIVNMGGRTYDSFFKRFTSPDIFVDGNRYAYVDGNPSKYIDPSGYQKAEEPDTKTQGGCQTFDPCWYLAQWSVANNILQSFLDWEGGPSSGGYVDAIGSSGSGHIQPIPAEHAPPTRPHHPPKPVSQIDAGQQHWSAPPSLVLPPIVINPADWNQPRISADFGPGSTILSDPPPAEDGAWHKVDGRWERFRQPEDQIADAAKVGLFLVDIASILESGEAVVLGRATGGRAPGGRPVGPVNPAEIPLGAQVRDVPSEIIHTTQGDYLFVGTKTLEGEKFVVRVGFLGRRNSDGSLGVSAGNAPGGLIQISKAWQTEARTIGASSLQIDSGGMIWPSLQDGAERVAKYLGYRVTAIYASPRPRIIAEKDL